MTRRRAAATPPHVLPKEEEEADPQSATRSRRRRFVLHSQPSVRLDLSYRLYPPTHSPTPPTSTLRATRAHDADLLKLNLIYYLFFYRTTLARHQDSQGYSSILSL